jgi:hypothetical protein
MSLVTENIIQLDATRSRFKSIIYYVISQERVILLDINLRTMFMLHRHDSIVMDFNAELAEDIARLRNDPFNN